MDCLCRPYDPDTFGQTFGVIRHRGERRQINLQSQDESMLLSSWKYWKARGMASPFDRTKKDIRELVAEPELRSQIKVDPPAIESVAAVVVKKERPAKKMSVQKRVGIERKESVNKGKDDGR